MTLERPFLPLGLCTWYQDCFLPVGSGVGSSLVSLLPGALQSQCARRCCNGLVHNRSLPHTISPKTFQGLPTPLPPTKTRNIQATLIGLAYEELWGLVLAYLSSFISYSSFFHTLCRRPIHRADDQTFLFSACVTFLTPFHPSDFYLKTYAVNLIS